jgi:hypothetical protein
MADFSHLKALAVSRETTKEYVFDRIEGEPSVIVAPATDDNTDFLNARLDVALADAPEETADKPKKKQSGKVSREDLVRQYDESRETDCRLIADTCIRDWGTPPLDRAGKAVEFTPQNAYEFLMALPHYMVDPFRGFCVNIYNFVPKPGHRKSDEEKLGNS